MLIRNLALTATGGARISSATVVWEDRNFPDQVLTFEIEDDAFDTDEADDRPERGDRPSADAFLAACFPLAAIHGEARVRIEGHPCPMLIEGLRTVHAWWTSWGGMLTPAPEIETIPRGRGCIPVGPRRAVAFLSGGVDGLHMLMRNRRLYRKDDPAYIRDALFIHGIDIGKRARDPEDERFRMALRRLDPVAVETGIRIIPCRTNLRHLPSQPGFFEHRHSGAALAAVGHAALAGPAFLFISGTYSVDTPVPWGSHPAVDGLLSSQRVTVIHDGSRFSRLQKVRDIAGWPAALAALRPCPAKPGGSGQLRAVREVLAHPARTACGRRRGDRSVRPEFHADRALGGCSSFGCRRPRHLLRGLAAGVEKSWVRHSLSRDRRKDRGASGTRTTRDGACLTVH